VAFHEAVTAAAGNALLGEMASVTRSRMHRLLGQHDDIVAMVEEHAAILDAIEARDAQRAGWLAERHLASSRTAALQRLGRDKGGDGPGELR
jgi:DNA-binding GntR family transcriptional regulator